MSWWEKALVGVAIWTAISAAATPVLGRWLARNREQLERLERLHRDVERIKAGERNG